MKILKNITVIKYIIVCCLSFLTMLAMAVESGLGITGIDIVLPCLFALCVIVYSKTVDIMQSESRNTCMKDLKFNIPLGIIASLATVVGSKIDMEAGTFTDFGITDVLFVILLVPFFVAILELLFFSSDVISKRLNENGVSYGLTDKKGSDKTSGSKKTGKKILLYAGIIFVCWLPYYLTFFPGGISNDVYECLNMIYGNIQWTNHHPILYVATIKLFVNIFASSAGVTFALGMMVLAYMIIYALSLACIVVWLEYRGANRAVCILALLFFALHSANAMMSIYLAKDVPFVCVFVFLTLFLFDYIEGYKSRELRLDIKRSVILAVLSVLTVLTRNNGSMIITVALVVFICMCKHDRKKLIAVAVAVFAFTAIYKGPIWNSLDIEKQSFVEAASIPLAQIGYTVKNDGVIKGEDREYLESIMPLEIVKERYIVGNVDSYKFDENFNTQIVDDNPFKLIKVWAHILPDNFLTFVKAYLMQTSGYWHYGETNTLCTEGVQPNDLGVVGVDIVNKITGISLGSVLSGLMLIVRKLPILCWLTQMPIQLMAVILTAYQYWRKNRKYKIAVLVPLLAMWGTLMLAVPSYCLFRYMLSFFLLWPVILVEFFGVRLEGN